MVEDNLQNLKLARVILTSAGHEVAEATDATEAHERIDEGVPDLILMDLGLPGMDGYELTRQLRSSSPTRGVPILAVTSFAMRGDAEKAIEAGCSDYLTKPIHRATLLERVRALLAVRGVGGAA